MKLHEIRPPAGAKTRKRIVGRGIGSGMGKTATRGTKGQKARNNIHPKFEGGQTPLQRRLPVKKGFRNIKAKEYAIINLDDLENLFEKGDEVTPEKVLETRIIADLKDGLKVLGFGALSKSLKVTAHKFSKSAREAIERAGGEAITL